MRRQWIVVAKMLAAGAGFALAGCGLPACADPAYAAEPPPALSLPAAIAASDNGLHKTPLFRKFGVAEGLPSSSVHALAEDRDGFIWLATVDGLARYDGVGFHIYRHDPNDPGSIAGNDITTLFIDSENRIWCGMESAGLDML
ncbi:MAG: ligand-binding sensor domain-containing protein, partial [Rudaea sp.]